MWVGLLCCFPTLVVEAFGWDHVSCMIWRIFEIAYPPLFTVPLLVSVYQHFKESRIHAKMASHAANNTMSPKRSKNTFSELVSSLKEERNHLRRNIFISYMVIMLLYGVLMLVLVLEEEKRDPLESFLEPASNEEGCYLQVGFSISGFCLAMLGLAVMGSTVYFTHKEKLQDDFGINKEYKIVLVFALITIPTYAILTMAPVLTPGILYQDMSCGVIDPSIIFIVTMVFVIGVLVTWPALRTFKGEHAGAGLTRLSVEHTDLNEVLNSNLYIIFLEHLKGEFSVENCVFWKHVEELKRDYGGGGDDGLEEGEGGVPETLKKSVRRGKSFGGGKNQVPIEAALEVYSMYIKQGSPMEINISSALREDIQSKLGIEANQGSRKKLNSSARMSTSDVMLGAEAEHVALDVFDEAQATVFKLMQSDSLPRFKNGKIFQGYVEAMTADKRGGEASKEPVKASSSRFNTPTKRSSNNPQQSHMAGVALARGSHYSNPKQTVKKRPTGPVRRAAGRGAGAGAGARASKKTMREKKLSDDGNNLLANIVSDNQL